MNKKYHKSLQSLFSGDTSATALELFKSRDTLHSNDDQALERQLISFRLALKSGNLQAPSDSLDETRTQNTFLKAEILFVKGSYYGQISCHEKAASCFRFAAELYDPNLNHEKWALSQFNCLIAMTFSSSFTIENERVQVENLLLYCREHKITKVEYLCLRHQSFRLFEEKQYLLAIDKIILWLGRKEALTKSDSELGLLHIADCYYESGDLRRALFYFDQVPQNVDERLRFPRAYLEAKIFQKSLDVAQFPVISDHWMQRYKKTKLPQIKSHSIIHSHNVYKSTRSIPYTWNLKNSLLYKGRQIAGRIKSQSLEGQLLRLLSDGARTKPQITESLWPAEMETLYLNDRFHQLVQRINRKVKGLVLFDGQTYRLSHPIKILS